MGEPVKVCSSLVDVGTQGVSSRSTNPNLKKRLRVSSLQGQLQVELSGGARLLEVKYYAARCCRPWARRRQGQSRWKQ